MRTVCAYTLSFPGTSAASEVWDELASWITGWYAKNVPNATLPTSWANGMQDTLVPRAGDIIECKLRSVDEAPSPLRELRWIRPDDDDPTLRWTVEALALATHETIFTLAVRIASADFELRPVNFEFGTPRVIRQLLARGDAHIGAHRVVGTPTYATPEDVVDLATLLYDENRRHPIVVISPEPYTDDVYTINPNLVATTLAGLASVCVMGSRWSGFALTDEIGKRLSCYNGAVRIYWPRFNRDSDPYDHPLWLPEQMREYDAPTDFAKILMSTIARAASFRYVEPEAIRSYRTKLDDDRIAAIRANSGKADYDKLFDEYVKLDTKWRELREKAEADETEITALKGQLASRWAPSSPQRAKANVEIDDRPEPETVHEAVEEARRRVTRLVFLPEALESAKDSPFRQPDKAYSALLAIEDVAILWAKQLAGGAKLGARRDLFKNRGFDYKEDISQTSEARWGSEYTYNYDGKRVLFAPHITIGAKAADRCLSIHMYWDEKNGKIVIAHVGRHKTNTRT